MSPTYQDNLSRIDDLENLMLTARELASRLADVELSQTRTCIETTLVEIRSAKERLVAKWSKDEA